jgi:hypothetical protein
MADGTDGGCIAKAKKTEPRKRLLEWRVSLIKGTPAKFIGYAHAPDAKTAEDIVAEEHKIPDTLRDRLVAFASSCSRQLAPVCNNSADLLCIDLVCASLFETGHLRVERPLRLLERAVTPEIGSNRFIIIHADLMQM